MRGVNRPEERVTLSGTRVREMLQGIELPPPEDSRREVAAIPRQRANPDQRCSSDPFRAQSLTPLLTGVGWRIPGSARELFYIWARGPLCTIWINQDPRTCVEN